MEAVLLVLLFLRISRTSAHNRATVTVTPSRSQFFEYEKVIVSCVEFSYGEWKVWRYTGESADVEPVVSQCGWGWGIESPAACELKTIKQTDGGVYWCESDLRDSSHAINITVTGGEAILQSPSPPVKEGEEVTLSCKTKSSIQPATFYKDGVLIPREATTHLTIYNFSQADQGSYRCNVSRYRESLSSWLLMEDDSDPAWLTTSSDSSQGFEYENLSISCGNESRTNGWKLVRALASGNKLYRQSCGGDWGVPTETGCSLQTVKRSDSAVYWCEIPARKRSNSVNISIYDSPVILQSPVLPVMEGGDVTLLCKTKTPPSSLPAAFYKDGSLISTEPAGHMTLHHVSRSDEGFYKCHIGGNGTSPESWLSVRDPNGTASAHGQTVSVWTWMRHLLVFCPYFISTVILLSFYRHKPSERKVDTVYMTQSAAIEDDEDLDQPYDDVIADVTTEHHF